MVRTGREFFLEAEPDTAKRRFNFFFVDFGRGYRMKKLGRRWDQDDDGETAARQRSSSRDSDAFDLVHERAALQHAFRRVSL